MSPLVPLKGARNPEGPPSPFSPQEVQDAAIWLHSPDEE